MKKDSKNNSGNRNSGDSNSGNWNSGNSNSGDSNSGDSNSGDSNSGNWNSGNRNSGNRNSGYSNSGNWNSGNWNSGDSNSGYRNSGYRNSGNRNSGDSNSGTFNSTNYSSGVFNNKEANILMFNKSSNWTMNNFYESKAAQLLFRVNLTKWISESEMSDLEKQENQSFYTTGGYLKILEYKDACLEMWGSLTDIEKEEIMKLPNFDSVIFLDITGIDVGKTKSSCDGRIVEIEGKKYQLKEVK